jgi:CheY-like chemotaxis protein
MQILVVEDEGRMAELLEQALHEEGHQVVLARDGREGFEIARYSPFDVIVLDVMLPGMDGLAVAENAGTRQSDSRSDADRARCPADIVNGPIPARTTTSPSPFPRHFARPAACGQQAGSDSEAAVPPNRGCEAGPGQPRGHTRR